jgi:acylphosphatase
MNGSSDVAQHNQIDVASPHSWVMDPANIRRAWLSTKRRFPLLAAKLVRKSNDDVFFEVAEGRVQNLIDGELEIGTLSSDDEVAQLTETFLNGPRELAFDMQAKVKVMALPKRGSHRKNDYYTRFHIWLITSHPVADGAANMSLFTTFMTMLTCPSQRITRQSIGARLSMVPDGETLHPDPPKSVARKRWRMAIAWAVMKTKEAKVQVSTILSLFHFLVADFPHRVDIRCQRERDFRNLPLALRPPEVTVFTSILRKLTLS